MQPWIKRVVIDREKRKMAEKSTPPTDPSVEVDERVDQLYKKVIDKIPERYPNLVKAFTTTPPHTATVQMSEAAFSAILDYKDEVGLIDTNPKQFNHRRFSSAIARLLEELHNSSVNRVKR